ncbi:hypothetical protein [Litoreibacter roseus]|uniref:Pilus assembly protein n=1 Tax=Litoreibacter roseus TaxID=2601869 RepID=A0A6N6JGE9_9RHOB|nr:hypothetical protein [Litoreibacter roseus]GFE65411.1 hypothetical protein KIN_24850 [Litoreibacter roseus]
MKHILRDFAFSENGAVTVDWVVLTAGMAFMGFVAAASVWDGAAHIGSTIDNDVTAIKIEKSFK